MVISENTNISNGQITLIDFCERAGLFLDKNPKQNNEVLNALLENFDEENLGNFCSVFGIKIDSLEPEKVSIPEGMSGVLKNSFQIFKDLALGTYSVQYPDVDAVVSREDELEKLSTVFGDLNVLSKMNTEKANYIQLGEYQKFLQDLSAQDEYAGAIVDNKWLGKDKANFQRSVFRVYVEEIKRLDSDQLTNYLSSFHNSCEAVRQNQNQQTSRY